MEQDFHNGVARELGGIHENLKGIHGTLEKMNEQMTIANGRTRKLEDENLVMKTRVGVISAVISAGVAFVIWLVNFFFR